MTSRICVSVSLLLFLSLALASPIRVPRFEAAAVSPDFSISANPTSVIVNPGPQGNSTITLTSQQGFAGRVNMTADVSPHGLYCQLTETSLNVTTNGSNSTTLHCDGFPGIYTVNVTGNATRAAASVSHRANINYVVTDFTISENPSSISVQKGHEASSALTISSQQAFTQNIYLNLTLPSGINGTITPTVLSGPGTTTISVNSTVAGVYNLTIIAASGSIIHRVWLLVAVTNPQTIFELQPLIFYTALTVILVGSAGVLVILRHRRKAEKGETIHS